MTTNRLRTQNKLKTIQRGTLVVACFSIVGILSYFIIGLLQTTTSDSKASGQLDFLASDPINNSEIICGFTWEKGLPSQSDVGPSAEKMSSVACITTDGCENSHGLCAGNNGRSINMFLSADNIFNSDGIDVGLDFRRYEASCNFFTRGNYFNFGMKDGFLTIKYKYKGENGKLYSVDEITKYEIPKDTIFRNYRFFYNPQESKGEIFVENVAIWSSHDDDGRNLWWNETDDIIIGNEMNGESCKKAIIDNVIIRSTVRGRTMPLKLLSFTAEIQGKNVMLNWFTNKENGTEYFVIERSIDTHSYEEIGRVKAAGKSDELLAYALLDTKPSLGICYYRISMPNTDIKSVWVPVIALKYTPSPFPAVEPTSASGGDVN